MADLLELLGQAGHKNDVFIAGGHGAEGLGGLLGHDLLLADRVAVVHCGVAATGAMDRNSDSLNIALLPVVPIDTNIQDHCHSPNRYGVLATRKPRVPGLSPAELQLRSAERVYLGT